jgi:dTMP kinase
MVLISFEGEDGTGKTTQMKQASRFLYKLGVDHITTQEFSGDEKRNSLRRLFMDKLDPMQELMVVSLARLWHMKNVIQPNLDAGKVIIIDRYIDSTWAYQNGGRGISKDIIQFMEDHVWQVPKPDLVIYLSGKPKRIKKNDRFEIEEPSFFKRVREVYDSRQSDNWCRIDSDDFDEVKQLIRRRLKDLFNL